jgi:hypothetical protein
MNRFVILISFILLALGFSCFPAARPTISFDEICKNVEGKTTVEVEKILGKPSYQKVNDLGEEKWIWWNYAVLDGDSYPPEVRGQVVHIEITFTKPVRAFEQALPHSQWRVRRPFGVSFLLPRTKA